MRMERLGFEGLSLGRTPAPHYFLGYFLQLPSMDSSKVTQMLVLICTESMTFPSGSHI